MAVSTGRTLISGSDIMLFTYQTNGYKSLCHGTSHSLSLSADTEDINTKDAGKYGLTEINKINWEIQADHMYTEDEYDNLFQTMTYMKPITVVFGLKDSTTPGTENVNIDSDDNWVANASYIYSGKAIITSLDWQADAGSKSTVSVTLQGQGGIKKGSPSENINYPTTA